MKRLAALLAAEKIFLLAFVALLPWLWPGRFNLGNFQANFRWPPGAAPSWSALFATWDAQHFLYLAGNGYQPGAASNNFFPLWPWLIRLGASVLRSELLSALILSNALSLAGLLLFFLYIRDAAGEALAKTSLLILLAYPGAFFLCLPFSESLFLLLAAGLFLSLARGRLAPAAACAFLLPLARPQGVLAAGAYWLALRRMKRVELKDLPLWLAPAAGAFAYLAFMARATGDAFEGIRLYHGLFPGSPDLLQALNPVRFLGAFVSVTTWHGTSGSLMERLWFVLFLAGLPALWKRQRLLFWYALPMGLVPAATLSFVSYTRHLLLVFPVFFAAAEWLEERPPLARRAAAAAAFAFQLFLLALHADNYWVA